MTDRAEQLRSLYEAINRGDFEALDELVAPGFEWHPNPGEPETAVRRGREQGLARVRDFVAAFGSFRTDVEEIRDLGERVAVAVRHRGTLAGSSDEVERREAHLWTFTGKRPVSLHEYPTLAAALDAAADASTD